MTHALDSWEERNFVWLFAATSRHTFAARWSGPPARFSPSQSCSFQQAITVLLSMHVCCGRGTGTGPGNCADGNRYGIGGKQVMDGAQLVLGGAAPLEAQMQFLEYMTPGWRVGSAASHRHAGGCPKMYACTTCIACGTIMQ